MDTGLLQTSWSMIAEVQHTNTRLHHRGPKTKKPWIMDCPSNRAIKRDLRIWTDLPHAVIMARSSTKYNLLVPRKWFCRSYYNSSDAVFGVNERTKRAYKRAYDRAMMGQLPLVQKHLRPWLISEKRRLFEVPQNCAKHGVWTLNAKKHIIICPQLYFTVLICWFKSKTFTFSVTLKHLYQKAALASQQQN